MVNQVLSEKEYDFAYKDPNEVLTQDELEKFDEGMKLKNRFCPSNQVDFARAACYSSEDIDRLFP